MENWKNNLTGLLKQMKLYPYERWNNELHKWLKEYSSVVNDATSGVLAASGRKKNDYQTAEIRVDIRHEKTFFAFLKYEADEATGEPVLKITSTLRFYPEKEFASIFSDNSGEEKEDITDFYEMTEDTLHYSEEPIAENEFVMEYITIMFRKFAELRGLVR